MSSSRDRHQMNFILFFSVHFERPRAEMKWSVPKKSKNIVSVSGRQNFWRPWVSVSSFLQILVWVSEREPAHSRSLTTIFSPIFRRFFWLKIRNFDLSHSSNLLWRTKWTVEFKCNCQDKASPTQKSLFDPIFGSFLEFIPFCELMIAGLGTLYCLKTWVRVLFPV